LQENALFLLNSPKKFPRPHPYRYAHHSEFLDPPLSGNAIILLGNCILPLGFLGWLVHWWWYSHGGIIYKPLLTTVCSAYCQCAARCWHHAAVPRWRLTWPLHPSVPDSTIQCSQQQEFAVLCHIDALFCFVVQTTNYRALRLIHFQASGDGWARSRPLRSKTLLPLRRQITMINGAGPRAVPGCLTLLHTGSWWAIYQRW